MNVNSSVRYGPPQHGEVLARADEAALTRAELRADAELFKIDEEFARSLGIEMTPFEVMWGRKGVRVREVGAVLPSGPSRMIHIEAEKAITARGPRDRTS